ncbi:unnamed protein product [Polarella glacialis]|uniref:Uncharacterized protein n=1 Tax=Polarella glacialis TaxID=89957 RepID=A0A813G766_POLGL|nr:unnamed protein product [Polarella glacialis]
MPTKEAPNNSPCRSIAANVSFMQQIEKEVELAYNSRTFSKTISAGRTTFGPVGALPLREQPDPALKAVYHHMTIPMLMPYLGDIKRSAPASSCGHGGGSRAGSRISKSSSRRSAGSHHSSTPQLAMLPPEDPMQDATLLVAESPKETRRMKLEALLQRASLGRNS